jgi:chemotaxis protein CheD
MNYVDLPAKEIERLARTISPGDWAVEAALPIATLLGSCVAVCMYDPVAKIGGMNHFMLPNMARTAHSEEDALLAGDYCMEALRNGLLMRGAKHSRLLAKAFGGGNVVGSLSQQAVTIGQRNVEFAQEWLARERISLQVSDFLGPWSRKVLFLPSNGDAYCRRMTSSLTAVSQIAKEERAYAESLKRDSGGGKKVELF